MWCLALQTAVCCLSVSFQVGGCASAAPLTPWHFPHECCCSRCAVLRDGSSACARRPLQARHPQGTRGKGPSKPSRLTLVFLFLVLEVWDRALDPAGPAISPPPSGVALQQPRLHSCPVAAVTRPRELLAKHHGGSLAYRSGGQASEWSLGRRWGLSGSVSVPGLSSLRPGLSGLRRPPACFSSRPLLRLQRVPSRPLSPPPHRLLYFCFSRLPLRGPWRPHWVYVETLLGHVATGSGTWIWLSLGATVQSSTLIKRLTSSHHASGNWDLWAARCPWPRREQTYHLPGEREEQR